MPTHLLPIVLSAFVPLILGFIWYHQRLFGAAWLKSAGITPELASKGPRLVVFVVMWVLSVLLAFSLYTVVVHQSGVFSLFASQEGFGDPNSATHQQFLAIMEQVKDRHRTFGHGALHGALTSLFIILPILATNAMFERKGWKYIGINIGYWTLTLALMGGIVCQFG